MALNPDIVLVEEKPLYCPSMNDVAQALKDGLSENFETVEVSVVDCPDLTQKPFSLASQGLGGSPTILEVGGVPFLMPLVNRSKIYDFKDMNKVTGVNPAFIVGAGAGPFTYAGVNSELVANLVVKDGEVRQLSQIAKLKDESKGNEFVTETLQDSVTSFALLANLFVSEGKPGKVLRVHCAKRKGTSDFVTAARDSLLKGFPGKAIGVGGTFLVNGSKVKQHIMADFTTTPLDTEEKVNNWLRFYSMNPPLVALGTFVTNDPGLNLRVIHFHALSDHGEAGHYHYDTEPEKVEYLAYFNLGTKVVRMDRPQDESKLGHN
ncbi:ester hydrolase C11orf54 homolog isoform X2 [Homalodisca vitripennis]|uniref:ester hydrolase C11orf54 homolog isoform X2 n=1 Tax=Homalodisca vitripennis TaxID=197043 RepID=UPI001EECB28E|nr:ester hydrolase C11orf54 homolog isoform X2 [Homalodisca vitripennis]